MTLSRVTSRSTGGTSTQVVEIPPAGIFGSLGSFLRAIKYAEVWVLDMSRDVSARGRQVCQYAVHLTSRVSHLPNHPVFFVSLLAAEWALGDPGALRFPALSRAVSAEADCLHLQEGLHAALVAYLRSPACKGVVYRAVEDAAWDVRNPWAWCVRGKGVAYEDGAWSVNIPGPLREASRW